MSPSPDCPVLDRSAGSSVVDLIGRTPLVRLRRFERETPGVELYAKAEWQNPGGSVKDRAAARMILEGEASGALTRDRIILDATSGNTGIADADTTGPEIIEQTSGRLTHFVAGLGTSGTFVGTGRRLRQFNAAIQLISFQPSSPLHGLEGLKHMDSAIVPGIYDPALADEDLRIDTETAYEMVRRLAREEGLLAGISSGAALAAVLRVARPLTRGVVVAVFPDGAEK